MKPVITSLFTFIVYIALALNPDSLFTAESLKSITTQNEWEASIQIVIDQLEKEDKQETLLYLLKTGKQNNYTVVEANAAYLLGLRAYQSAEYKEALGYYQQALNLFEKENDLANLGKVCNLLATLSKKQKDYDSAHEYLNKTLEICTQINDSACISTVYDNRGLIYAEQQNFQKAKEYYMITLDIREKIKDTVGLGYVLSNLAEVASNEKNFKLAESYLLQSNLYKQISKDKFGEAVNYTNMGELLFKQKKYNKAIENFKKSLRMSREIGIPDLSQWNFQFISKCYTGYGETEMALSYLQQSYELKDSILNVEKLRQITEMETRFNTERKEQQLVVQKFELEKQKQKNQNLIWSSIAILSIISLIFFSVFLKYKAKKREQLQAAQISFQRDLLHTTIEAQEKERIRISKELHDGIGQQLSGLKMAWQQFGKSLHSNLPNQAKTVEDLNKVLGDAANEVRSISHQMMPKSLQEYGLLSATEDLLDKTFKHINIQYDFEHFGLDDRLDQSIELNTFRILQELLNNVVKHSQASEVSIQLMKSKNNLILAVEDNGKGIETATKDQQGHGLKNMVSRAQLMNGSLDFENIESGTLATLRVPMT